MKLSKFNQALTFEKFHQLTDSKLNTPLHLMAAEGNLGAARLLVQEGAEFGRIALNQQKKAPMEVATGACKVTSISV